MKALMDDDALAALSAFEPCVALVDVMHCMLRWCSPAFEARFGLSAGDSLSDLQQRLPGTGSALQAALDVPSRCAADAAPQRRSSSGTPCDADVQATLVRPGVVALKLTCAAQSGESGEAHQAQAARRHLEDRERLLFTSRTLSVSEMASTLAHELNQPIGTVVNVLRGMKSRLELATPPDSSLQSLTTGAQMALDQALFASRIIARIRDYTHARQPRGDLLDLGAVLRESLALLDWEIQRDHVQVKLDVAPAPCRVVGDEVMLQQILVNLFRNAMEAMRDGEPGKRRLEIRLSVQREGRDAELAIRDSGCGLPDHAEERLFVPFHSTKPNGMGIGLNICRSFIELHQGRLWFTRNEAGATPAPGSTFHVTLPLSPATAQVLAA